MSTISDKLLYLDGTRAKIKENLKAAEEKYK